MNSPDIPPHSVNFTYVHWDPPNLSMSEIIEDLFPGEACPTGCALLIFGVYIHDGILQDVMVDMKDMQREPEDLWYHR